MQARKAVNLNFLLLLRLSGYRNKAMKTLQKHFSKQLLCLSLLLLAAVYVSAQSTQTTARKLSAITAPRTIPSPSYLFNPVKLNSFRDCSSENIRQASFSPKYNRDDRVKMCVLIEKLRIKLWQSRNSVSELDYQVSEIWKATPYLYFEKVSWTKKFFGGTFGHAEYKQIFQPDGSIFKRGIIALSLNESTFPYTFLHELRHVRDLYDGYNYRKAYSSRQLEERGFLIESYYAEATNERAAFFKEFWRDEWRRVPRNERRQLALAGIERYMRKYYKDLFRASESNSAKVSMLAPNK